MGRKSMYRVYGITTSMDYYHSVTKMLVKPGHLDEAVDFVEHPTREITIA